MPPRARSRATRAAAAWLKTPPGGVAALILATFLARVVFASALGLGIDESYMVAAGRSLQLSYFDHPPIAWWMAWAAAHLTGSESPLVVRLPFIGLFAVTTFLMYRLTAALFSPEAGFWAAIVLNMTPLFGISAGTWVLPDGPLFAALLAAALCLIAGLHSDGRAAWGWWPATGICAGLALCSKYSAGLTIIGAVGFLLTEPLSRRWLARPHPYVAGLVALAIFLPVLVWNAENGWVSLLFQGGRADGWFHPFGPIATLAGAAAFLLPWIWAPLLVCGFVALRRGPSDREGWLLVCLAAPPLILFTAASLWGNVLFHWAAPGYLMLLPLFGDAVARHWRRSRAVRVCLAATGGFVVLGSSLFASEVRFDWLPAVIGDFRLGKDPSLDVVDWTSLRDDLAERGLLDRPRLVVAALRWSDAGKIDYALGGGVPVICLGPDSHQYGLTARPDDHAGADVLIVTRAPFEKIVGQYWSLFDAIEPIAPATVFHAGHPALRLNLFLGHRLHEAAEECCAS
ncbi:MAG TPA: glycosyltransferase family 39 protein [Stellaceae bacterium]|nr:glycosyltransferase family 39 protein [Stellaceae bacterium]